jgi:hypothetical protein
MNTRVFGALLLLAPIVASCGGGSDPFTRIESTYDGMVDALCRGCPAAAGATTESQCRTTAEANNPFTGAQWDCQRSVYHMYPNELGPYFDCVANATSGFDRCMRGAITTCPPASDAVSACSDQLDTAIRACPTPDSITASQAIAACSSNP